jgi:hypothetical protein
MSRLVQLLAERMRMLREDAVAVAKVVEDAFAGASELDDEVIGKDLRQVFYDLQDEKVLEIRREERRSDAGAQRFYLWRIREQQDLPVPDLPTPDATERLYARLEEQAWARRRPDGTPEVQ